MGSDSKKERFSRFHERVGKPEFAPDFLDSLIRVMADGNRCIEERVLAWAKYRAWGNHNEFAIHICGDPPKETPLGQQDCALDLAWLAAGRPAEWLHAPRDLLHAEFIRLDLHAPDKSVISRGFHANVVSGTIAPDTGWKIVPVVSPLSSSLNISQESTTFKKFSEWAKVAYSREFEEREVVRSRKKELDKFFVVKYKEWLKSLTPETPAAPSIIPIIPIIQEEAAAVLDVIPEEPEPIAETPPPFPERPTEHQNGNSAGTEAPTAVREPEPAPIQVEAFVEAVQAKFPHDPPTLSQCGRGLATLVSKKLPIEGFIEHLNPERMAKIKHGGALDGLIEGYAVTVAAKAKAPPGCPYCHSPNMRDGKCAACGRTPEMAHMANSRDRSRS